MVRVLPILVLIALTVYCAVEVAQAPPYQVRRAPKWLWAVVVIFVPLIGPLSWLAFGRPGRADHSQLLPPDDDPDFLRRR